MLSLSIYESTRLTIRHLKPPVGKSALLCAIHFQDKNYNDDISQALESTVLAQTINEQERIIGHQRTILVGDLNMNPFEPGVVGASGLHAVMTRELARKRRRIVAGKQYNFFYNPMWGQFGDSSPGPPGTYYYQSSQHVSHFWHMFDQVLLRPDLIDCFDSDELRILDRIGGDSLLKADGVPDKRIGSDHLPILFRMEL